MIYMWKTEIMSKHGGDNYPCPHKFRYPCETAIWTIANICPSDDGLAQLCVAAKCRCYVVLRSLAGLTRQTDRIPLLFQCIFSLKTIRPRRTWKSPQLDWLSLNFFPSTFQIPADKKKKRELFSIRIVGSGSLQWSQSNIEFVFLGMNHQF